MKQRDKEHLQARLRELNAIIKAEHAKPKDQRDPKAISDAKMRIANINSWLAEPKQRTGSSDPKVMTKKMFREKFNETFNIGEPTEHMVIDTVEELNKIWPKIRGANIQISGPKEVLAAMKCLVKNDAKNIQISGFR